jgi:hypothetical protein
MQHLRLETSLTQKMHTAMQMSIFLDHWCEGFWSHVRHIESGELFLKLSFSRKREKKALFINPRPAAQLVEAFSTPPGPPEEVEELLLAHQETVKTLKSLGREVFMAFFLGEEAYTPAELAEATGLDYEELKSFHDQVILPTLLHDMTTPLPGKEPRRPYEKIAVLKHGDAGVECLLLSERKRYHIDEEKVSRLAEEGWLSHQEHEAWPELKKELELVNERLNLGNRVVLGVVEAQQGYLLSGREEDLAPLEEKDMASSLSIDRSWLCRLIRNKSLMTAYGEKALHFFFLSQRRAKKQRGMKFLLELLSRREGDFLGDGMLAKLLKERYGVGVSRRTVSDWRRAIEARLRS